MFLNSLTGKRMRFTAALALFAITLGCASALCGCAADDPDQGQTPSSAKSIEVGLISISYPEEYGVLSEESTSKQISEDGSGYSLSRTIVGTEDYAVTYIVEHVEGMTLADAKAEVEKSMGLLDNPDGLDDATLALAKATAWEPMEDARVDGRDGFISSSVMYGDTKVIAYHVETGPDSIGIVTGGIPLDLYEEDPAAFAAVFSSIGVL